MRLTPHDLQELEFYAGQARELFEKLGIRGDPAKIIPSEAQERELRRYLVEPELIGSVEYVTRWMGGDWIAAFREFVAMVRADHRVERYREAMVLTEQIYRLAGQLSEAAQVGLGQQVQAALLDGSNERLTEAVAALAEAIADEVLGDREAPAMRVLIVHVVSRGSSPMWQFWVVLLIEVLQLISSQLSPGIVVAAPAPPAAESPAVAEAIERAVRDGIEAGVREAVDEYERQHPDERHTIEGNDDRHGPTGRARPQ